MSYGSAMLHRVAHHDRPVLHRLELDTLELDLARETSEEGTTLPDRDGRDGERELVDEIGREKTLGETGAVLNDDVFAVTAFQRRDLFGGFAARESSVLPRHLTERPREDNLVCVVEPL